MSKYNVVYLRYEPAHRLQGEGGYNDKWIVYAATDHLYTGGDIDSFSTKKPAQKFTKKLVRNQRKYEAYVIEGTDGNILQDTRRR